MPGSRACFVFAAEWDARGLDEQGRPGKAVFGYFCAAPGQPVSRRRIDLLLSQIDFRKPENDYARPLHGRDPAALAFAQSGIRRFPFDFGRKVKEGRGDRRRP